MSILTGPRKTPPQIACLILPFLDFFAPAATPAAIPAPAIVLMKVLRCMDISYFKLPIARRSIFQFENEHETQDRFQYR
jgi:hypothetical protein